jgi:hypothetical protein
LRLIPRSRRARALAGGCALAALLLSVELGLSGRTRPPVAARESAIAAVEEARVVGAPHWAPPAFSAADAALRAALLDWSRQQGRLLPLRDFRPVGLALDDAAALALRAAALGAERREAEHTRAEQSLREARAAEAQAEALVAATALPHAQRVRLRRARLLVAEAAALLRDGEIEAARERAEQSRAELRLALGPALQVAERYTSPEQLASWRRWIEETRAWSRSSGQPAILVLKEKNLLVLLSKGAPLLRYAAEVGANALGVKARQGDRATPEGRYRVVKKKDRGQSRYHRALLLDYPNAEDRARFAAARRRGEIPAGTGIGSLIEIHGDGGRGQNWTDGCVALTNADMDDLFARVGVGTRVTIVGGDGSDGAFSDLLAQLSASGGGQP